MDFPDSTGKTPLHIAAGNGYVWGVKALLESGADPSIKDKVDRSAAEYAKQRGKLDASDRKKRERMECVVAIENRMKSIQEARDILAQSNASPYAPFLQKGDQTSPNSRGLSLVVYHQVQWLIFSKCTDAHEISERLMRYLRSSEACVVVSALKDFEVRYNRGERAGTLEDFLSFELSQAHTLRGSWQVILDISAFKCFLSISIVSNFLEILRWQN